MRSLLWGRPSEAGLLRSDELRPRTVQVEEEQQKVISTGLYRLVRYPMYLDGVLMLLFTPLALGSWRERSCGYPQLLRSPLP